MKPILIAGIQPTNRLTLGNYLGSIKKMVEMQEEYKCIFFVADLHSQTIPTSYSSLTKKEINEFKKKVLKMYIASGVDTNKSLLFVQSEIKEHLELFYFLLTHSFLGELKRMTQYKHLSKKFINPNQTESALVGLLVYPVLMAADILLYDSEYVSIGEDQTQHLELTRELATRINERYKQEIFKIPKALEAKGNKAGIKIKDLQDPNKKMSKSSESYDGVIFLDDSVEDIKNKIMKAKTDSLGKISLDKEKQPGIVNLIEIYASITNISIEKAFERLENNTYKELKEVVAEVVIKEITKLQNRYKEIKDEDIDMFLKKHTDYCQDIAKKKMIYISNVT